MITQSNRRYKLLDLLRLFCACLVIFIHMGLGDDVAFVPCMTRQAVPFFFLVSGFFFSKRIENEESIKAFTIRYIKPLLIVFLFWSVLWLPQITREALNLHADRSTLYVILVVLRRFVFAGIAPYWYLLALIEGVIILAVVLRYRAFLIGYFLCLLGFVLRFIYELQLSGGFGGAVYQAFYNVFSWENNVIMTGFPLVFLGYLMARYEEKLIAWKQLPIVLLLLYIASVIIPFLIFSRSQPLYHIPFGIIQAVLLFLVSLCASPYDSWISPKLCRWSRNLSSVIFLTHTAFLVLFAKVFHIWDTIPRFILTVLASVLLMTVVRKLNWKPLWKVLMIK